MKKTNLKKSLQSGKKPYAILGVTGGIAAYKSAHLARLLVEQFHVRVIMTGAAKKFITGLTFHAITDKPVLCDMFSPNDGASIAHIDEASRASIIIVAPATADFISRLACGSANDLLCSVVLASRCPVLLAPGMNTVMWENPMTQKNVETLLILKRFNIIGPDAGELACGREGAGRMSDPAEIVQSASGILRGGSSLKGKKVVVTAGPTVEEIDPVRFISNRSSGKMGYAVARAAKNRKADVTLISGPTHLSPPPGVHTIHVSSTARMKKAVLSSLKGCDVLFMSAAVADWKPRDYRKDKIRKDKTGDAFTLNLARNPDILALCAEKRRGRLPLIFGFSLETRSSRLLSTAKTKLRKKKCDFIVANLAQESLSEDETSATVISAKGKAINLTKRSKDAIAHALLDIASKNL